MLGSFKIGSVLGITVRVHWLFLALVLFVLLWPNGQGSGAEEFASNASQLALLTLLFGVVFLHELGHSLVARRFGIHVYDITFWPLGGMARMSEIPESSRAEALIAVAGPAVNFVLAALATPLALWSAFEASQATTPGALRTVAFLSGAFVWINLVLGIFNLIPAFPMDGGRVLRAFLARSGDWVGATERAVRVGRIFAVLMIAVGLVFPGQGLLFLPLIGLFVWFSGARELWAVRARHGRMPFGPFAGQPMPGSSAAWSAPPPPTARERPRSSSEPSGARRPEAPVVEIEPEGEARPRPLSSTDIERLERFQGPLRHFRPDA